MSVVSICKAAIAFNVQNGWGKPTSHRPVRVQAVPRDEKPIYCYVADICDANGNVVASVVTTKNGDSLTNFGTHVVVFTQYPVKVKA